MIRYVLSFLISVCLLALQVTTTTADEPGSDELSIDLTNLALRDFGVKEVNRLLGKKLPFLELSYSDVDDDSDENGFILGYDWNKDWNNYEYEQGSIDKNYGATIYQVSLSATGSHGLGDVANPKNKSEVGFSIDLSRAGFGKLTKQLTRDESDKLQQCVDRIAIDDPDLEIKIDACSEKYKAIEVFEANHARDYQWIYGVDAHAKIEGDEDFAQKHFVFGLELIGTFNPPAESVLSWLNIPDWPFFITRKAFNSDKKFYPDWPVFRAGIQSIEVEDNDLRKAAAPNENSYIRYFGEVAFTTNVCTVNGRTIKFNTAYEYYKEIDADPRIKAAGLDEFYSFSVSFQAPVTLLTDKVSDRNMFFVRYVNGELPFDRKSTKAFEIGWQSSFNPMGLISSPPE